MDSANKQIFNSLPSKVREVVQIVPKKFKLANVKSAIHINSMFSGVTLYEAIETILSIYDKYKIVDASELTYEKSIKNTNKVKWLIACTLFAYPFIKKLFESNEDVGFPKPINELYRDNITWVNGNQAVLISTQAIYDLTLINNIVDDMQNNLDEDVTNSNEITDITIIFLYESFSVFISKSMLTKTNKGVMDARLEIIRKPSKSKVKGVVGGEDAGSLTNINPEPITEYYDIMEMTECGDIYTFGKSLMDKYSVGLHVSKSKTLLETVQNLEHPDRPYQIFLGSNLRQTVKADPNDIIRTKQYVIENDIKLYVHLPYVFNIARDNDDISVNICEHLRISEGCGFKGVVLHVGKSVELGYEIALENSIKNIKKVLNTMHTNLDCPLLIETPAGQGTEMFQSSYEFLYFVQSFEDERVRACIDTAHVYSTNYMPTDYLNQMDLSVIKLIHFNDSQVCKGACRDRHEFLGNGFIPKDELIRVAEFGRTHSIPMILEF